MRTETITYRSSVDDSGPLYVDVVYDDTKSNLPIVVVMHGYRGGRKDLSSTLERLAEQGLFAAAPDMRGYGDSKGRRDSGGVEVMDIYDAISYIRGSFGNRVDGRNVNIIGYSGGGGNVFSCVVRFPDLFRCAVSFFGISDYGYWYEHTGDPDVRRQLEEDVGGSPQDVPDKYMARNSLLGAVNNPYTAFYLFWDEEETLCPPYFDREYHRRAQEVGYTNVYPYESHPGDPKRWLHGYPHDVPDLIAAEEYFLPGILSGRYPLPEMVPRGKLVVLGYLKAKDFSVWLGNGDDAVAECRYLWTENERRFFFKRLSSDPDVRGELWISLEGMNFPVKVYRNDALVEELSEGEEYTYGRFQLDDRFRFVGG
ncbi:MAG TPA: alpha/beta fold hydrolase [Candidatus Latescibacteria bacterium]|nr:alpha/beta fold hydrolase [Candidatus Latescibacterota bacterium]